MDSFNRVGVQRHGHGGRASTDSRPQRRPCMVFLLAAVVGSALGLGIVLYAGDNVLALLSDITGNSFGHKEDSSSSLLLLQHGAATKASSPTAETTRDVRWEDADAESVCNLSNVVVAIKSGASKKEYRDRRSTWRESHCAEIYQAHDMKFRFVVGLPAHQTLDPSSHNQGLRDTPDESRDLLLLDEEQAKHGDIEVLPVRDIYDDLYIKTFQTLQWANKQKNAEIIVVHDDEFCIDPRELLSMCRSAKAKSANLYGGHYLWEDPKGSNPPYFSGWSYVLSRPLLDAIVNSNSLLTGSHLPRAEDVRVGYWVGNQVDLGEIGSVLYAEQRNLLVEAQVETDQFSLAEDKVLPRELRELKPKSSAKKSFKVSTTTNAVSTTKVTAPTTTRVTTTKVTVSKSAKSSKKGSSGKGVSGKGKGKGVTVPITGTGQRNLLVEAQVETDQFSLAEDKVLPRELRELKPKSSAKKSFKVTTTKIAVSTTKVTTPTTTGVTTTKVTVSKSAKSSKKGSSVKGVSGKGKGKGVTVPITGKGRGRQFLRQLETASNKATDLPEKRHGHQGIWCGENTFVSSCSECSRDRGEKRCQGDCQWDFLADVCAAAQPVSCGSHTATNCNACPRGRGAAYCNGDCSWNEATSLCQAKAKHTHPAYEQLIKLPPFQPVRDDKGEYVNIILVRHMFLDETQEELYHRFKNDILFLGIMSYETFPFPSPNPRSFNGFSAEKYLEMFPGWLNMYRDNVFPANVKVLQMSQSDFDLPDIDFENEIATGQHVKRFDFAYVMSDLNTTSGECDSWGAHAKNWSFVRDYALDIMCGEMGMSGVLLVTKDEESGKACDIPLSCKGKIVQTPFLPQGEALDYMRQSRFVFLPQVWDASPRVATQAMTLNVPLLMNKNIVGGWKYVNSETGEFFHDHTDLRESVEHLMSNLDRYEPRKHVLEHYGDENAGARFRIFVEENFGDRLKLPPGSLLVPIFN